MEEDCLFNKWCLENGISIGEKRKKGGRRNLFSGCLVCVRTVLGIVQPYSTAGVLA